MHIKSIELVSVLGKQNEFYKFLVSSDYGDAIYNTDVKKFRYQISILDICQFLEIF
jgi:hypothetical protein